MSKSSGFWSVIAIAAVMFVSLPTPCQDQVIYKWCSFSSSWCDLYCPQHPLHRVPWKAKHGTGSATSPESLGSLVVMVTVALAPLPLQHHRGSHSPPTAMQHPTLLARYKGQTSTQRTLLTASKLPPPKSPWHQRQQQPFPSFASSSSMKLGAAARPGLAPALGEEPPFMLWPPNVITCKGLSWTATFGPCNANVPFHLRPSNRTSFFHFLHKKAFYCFCTCPLNSIASGAAIWQCGFYNVYYDVSTMAFSLPSTSLPNLTCISLAQSWTPGHTFRRPLLLRFVIRVQGCNPYGCSESCQIWRSPAKISSA